jgi:formyl-CoA transferase
VPRLSTTPGHIRTPAPALGEHTRAILEAIGCKAAEIEALAAAGTIRVGARGEKETKR